LFYDQILVQLIGTLLICGDRQLIGRPQQVVQDAAVQSALRETQTPSAPRVRLAVARTTNTVEQI
tara:strand:- start:165 stop:359 length:195 start_codon:yes stop_codon:yes gene_type:complete